jgi:23S rRNA (adenine2030-N6)-methyltransferase
MNYRHSYHAGNFADVFKHIILIALIQSLLRKDNGFCYLDTHAGAGYYDLFAETAQRTKEFANGIEKIFHQKNLPPLVKFYQACIQRLNNKLTDAKVSSLRYYPGSPMIMRHFLREQDRIILSELHPQECELLKKSFPNDPRIGIHLMDGYQALKAFLPPKEHRGLILIDPAYERPNEFTDLLTALFTAIKRFESGVYAIWYPIKDRASVTRFHKNLKAKIQRPILLAELNIFPENLPTHLNGCGMAIINPPWQVDKEIKEVLPWLCKTLSQHNEGSYSVKLL